MYTPQERANIYTCSLFRIFKYARGIEWEVQHIEHMLQEKFNSNRHALRLCENVHKFFSAVKANFIDKDTVAIVNDELNSNRMISAVALLEQVDNMTLDDIEELIKMAEEINKRKQCQK